MRTLSILFVPIILAVAGVLPSAIVNANSDHDAVIRDLRGAESGASIPEISESSSAAEGMSVIELVNEIRECSVVLERLQENLEAPELTPELRDRMSRAYNDIARDRKECVKQLSKRLVNLTVELSRKDRPAA